MPVTENPIHAREPISDREQKMMALGYLNEAWAEALHDGIDADCLALRTIGLDFVSYRLFEAVFGPVHLGFIDMILDSKFSLCPRGNGPASYRLQESMAWADAGSPEATEVGRAAAGV